MADLTELISGLFLWLGSTLFLLLFVSGTSKNKSNSISSTDLPSTRQPSSETKDSPPLPNNPDISESNVSLNLEKVAELEQQLQSKIKELTFAKKKITALEKELELTINELESTQDQSAKLKTQLEKEKQDLQQQVKAWQKKYSALNQELEKLPKQLTEDWQKETFAQLQSLLANYPTAKVMVKLKPDLPAKNLIALLKPLEGVWQNWGIEQIGKPWQQVPFNPQLHQPDSEDIIESELVYIRFVGYRQGDRILLPAKVSRHLPGQS